LIKVLKIVVKIEKIQKNNNQILILIKMLLMLQFYNNNKIYKKIQANLIKKIFRIKNKVFRIKTFN
jgi:hypothetical protein